jgi:tRNA C32,U32 (ribose-2'-O)-methylase TrmJ
LFYGNLSDVKEFFSSNKSVQSLNTPQEAAIFLYKFQQALKDNYKKDAEAVSTKAERTKLEEELQQLRKEYKEKTKDLKDDKKKKELQGKFEAKRDEINQKIKTLRDKQDIAM